jgi:hypothetical protein
MPKHFNFEPTLRGSPQHQKVPAWRYELMADSLYEA